MIYLLFTKGLTNKLLILMLNVIRVCGNECIYNEIAKWKGDKILYNIKLMNRIINSFKNTKLHESNKLKTKSINQDWNHS